MIAIQVPDSTTGAGVKWEAMNNGGLIGMASRGGLIGSGGHWALRWKMVRVFAGDDFDVACLGGRKVREWGLG